MIFPLRKFISYLGSQSVSKGFELQQWTLINRAGQGTQFCGWVREGLKREQRKWIESCLCY